MSHRSSCATPIRQNQIRFYVIVITTLCLLPASATAQTFKVIHSFTGGDDGAYPYAGLTLDKQGNLYGTANHGGVGDCFPDNFGCGTVYKLTRTQSGWTFQTLYEFTGTLDGGGPYGPVTIGPDGSLYGSTVGGGESTGCPSGCGAVYSLTPPNWTEKVLYSFEGGTDAFFPTGPVSFDSTGNLYGTTYIGGAVGPGAIWKLSTSNGSWAESLPWSFTGTADGGNPYQGVTIDSAGNIYCTAIAGGVNNGGAAIELVPQKSGYAETNVHDFTGGAEGFLP